MRRLAADLLKAEAIDASGGSIARIKSIVVLLHVFAAFAYVAGYVATNVLTEIARRTADASVRRQALSFSTRFDRMLNAPGGALVGITGIVAVVVFGYPLTTGWLLAAIVLYALITATGILFWSRVGRAIDRAAAAGDDEAMRRELLRPRNVAVSRLNVALVAIIALMVLRPF